MDDSRLLTPETRANLSDAISAAHESGLRLGFAATTVLPHPGFAAELREAWFPGEPRGVIVVYSRDLDRFVVSDARANDSLYHGVDANVALARANRTLGGFNRDRDGREPVIVAEASLYIRELARLANTSSRAHRLPDIATTIGIWLGAAAVLCLPIYFLLRGERCSKPPPHPLTFPDVVVTRRLGAPHGGITGAEIRFNETGQGASAPEARGQGQMPH